MVWSKDRHGKDQLHRTSLSFIPRRYRVLAGVYCKMLPWRGNQNKRHAVMVPHRSMAQCAIALGDPEFEFWATVTGPSSWGDNAPGWQEDCTIYPLCYQIGARAIIFEASGQRSPVTSRSLRVELDRPSTFYYTFLTVQTNSGIRR